MPPTYSGSWQLGNSADCYIIGDLSCDLWIVKNVFYIFLVAHNTLIKTQIFLGGEVVQGEKKNIVTGVLFL